MSKAPKYMTGLGTKSPTKGQINAAVNAGLASRFTPGQKGPTTKKGGRTFLGVARKGVARAEARYGTKAPKTPKA